MGQIDDNGVKRYFAFNLTRNQSVDQPKYNENVIWVDNESFPMPPVVFTHKNGKKKADEWHVTDEKGLGLVDVTFKINRTFYMPIPLLCYYALPYGTISGYVTDTNGKNTLLTACSASEKIRRRTCKNSINMQNVAYLCGLKII